MNWLIERLKEPSTWRGIVMLVTGFGLALSSEMQEQIITVGISLAGLIGMLTSDKKGQ
jgi:uncharacterized membrane protein